MTTTLRFDIDQLVPSETRELAQAGSKGVNVTISAGALGPLGEIPDDMDPVLKVVGPGDRIYLAIKDLQPKGGAPVAWPEISFVLGQGIGCVRDRRFFLSGPAPDVIALTGPTDKREGMMYEAFFLVGQWYLYAWLPSDYVGKFDMQVLVLPDWKGGGGSLACEKGRVFG